MATRHEPIRAAAGASRPAGRLAGFKGAQRQRGVTSLEYALLGALIATAIIVSVAGVGGELGNFYDYVAGKVGCAAQGKGNC